MSPNFELSLTDHISDLRKTLILSLVSLAIGFLLAIPLATPFIALLKLPAEENLHTERLTFEKAYNTSASPLYITLPKDSYDIELYEGATKKDQGYLIDSGGAIHYKRQEKTPHFVLLGPIQGFSVLMKCALFLGAILSAPLWLLALWRFIAPGLENREKNIAIPFLSSMLLFFGGGATLGYFFILPPSIHFLEGFGGEIGTNMWSLASYLEFCLFILFGSGLALELFFFLFLLVHFNVLTYAMLTSSRRAVVVACFILGALLTPPDVATQVLLAIPLWLLFEACVGYAYLKTD